MNTVIITVLDITDVAHFEFMPQGQTVNQVYYMEIWKRLREAVPKKGLKFGPTIGFSTMTLLQPTRCHFSSSFWPKNRIGVVLR
jgi:hypothetical protein